MQRINKTIPLYFDESLSYLEMIGILSDNVEEIKKLTETLNKVIKLDDTGNIVIDGNLDVKGELSSSTTVEKAVTAEKLLTPRKIELSGVVNGEIPFDGSEDVIIPTTIIDDINTNAATATKLQTPRKITLQGNVTGYANFDGSGDVIITTQVTGGSTDINSTVGNFTVGTGGSGDLTVAGDIKYRNNNNDIYVLQDGILKVDTEGNAATATTATTAGKLTTARTIGLSGDVTGSADFDGSANINIATTIGKVDSATNADNATEATWATKIGSADTHPAIGTNTRPIYVNAAGSVRACLGTVGSVNQPIYMQSGEFTACTYRFEVVDSLPTTYTANTIYFVKGA